ncbi:hypothetical protein CW304_11985 [Bacillus sp. UFRGS-B20]|nr:hypothetical protein CW304_11985 [Bacillus sp. UFRGS-B20]
MHICWILHPLIVKLIRIYSVFALFSICYHQLPICFETAKPHAWMERVLLIAYRFAKMNDKFSRKFQ